MQQNRLIVLGCRRYRPMLAAFANSNAFGTAGFRHFDLLECSPERYAWQFESTTDPLPLLRPVSRRKPGLIFLLEYERGRMKGLAKLHRGNITRHEITY